MAIGHINGEELKRPDPGKGALPERRTQPVWRHNAGSQLRTLSVQCSGTALG